MPGSFSKIIRLLFLVPLLCSPLFVRAQVSQIGFTTDPQTVNPGEISGILTFQLQDSSDFPAQATETFDIEFLSSSPSGEFLSPTSENPVTKTLATGSANKNFRYRDAAQGTHTLTVNATGRTSGLTVSGTQNIVVGSSSGGTTDTTSENNSNNSSSSGSGTHPSVRSTSLKKSEAITSVSAGRDRIGSLGSPLQFKAETNLTYTKRAQFRWNFGDGSEEYGEEITHTYEYPGEYVVVLSVSTPEGRGSARVNVKIVDPQLELVSASPEKIEIRNNAKQEVGLFGLALEVHGQTFLFPEDSIIKPSQTIAFSSKITGLRPGNKQEVLLLTLGQTERPKIKEKIETLKEEKISELQYKILALQEELASRRVVSVPAVSTVVSTTTMPESSVAAAVESLSQEIEPNTSWFATLKKFFLGNNQQSNK